MEAIGFEEMRSVKLTVKLNFSCFKIQVKLRNK